LEVLEETWPCELLIGFEWDGFLSWFSGLYLLDVDNECVYLCQLLEEQRLRAIAAIPSRNDRKLYSAFFKSLIDQNGRAYNVYVLGSLPTQTENFRPDLIPSSAVKEGYRLWQNWAEENGLSSWLDLLESVQMWLQQPDGSMSTFADLLRKQCEEIVRSAYPKDVWKDFTNRDRPLTEEQRRMFVGAIKTYFEARAEQSRGLPKSEREKILDRYFSLSYKE